VKDPLSFAVETIPWQECARLIQNCNARNRPLSEKRVETLARCQTQGRFLLTHQGIAFDPAGNIIDGQHRLASAARTKKDLRVLVCRYTNAQHANEAMAIFDSGRARSTADGLAIGGVMPKEDAKAMTAVVNVMALLMAKFKLDLQETGEFYRSYREAIRWSVANIPPKRGGAYVRAAFAIAWCVDAKKTSELAAQINEGAALPGTAAALWNRAFADGLLATPGGTTERRSVTWRALRILKSHLTGEKAPQKLYTSDEAFQWFMAQMGETTPASSLPVVEENLLSPLQTEILKIMPPRGSRLLDITGAVNRSMSHVQHNLTQMVDRGVVRKARRGFYVPTMAAA